jgi:hypothetical protein
MQHSLVLSPDRRFSRRRGAFGAWTVLCIAFALASTAPAVAAGCANEQLRVENNSTNLPECRAYDLITPEEKNGTGVTDNGRTQAVAVAASGERLLFRPIDTPTPVSRLSRAEPRLAIRTLHGWTNEPVAPAIASPTENEIHAVGASEDLSSIIIRTADHLVPQDLNLNDENIHAVDLFTTSPLAASGLTVGWLDQGPLGGARRGTEPPSNEPNGTALEGESSDLTHIVFDSAGYPLVAEDTHEYGREIYDRVDGSTTDLIGVLPGGVVPACGATVGAGPEGESGTASAVSATLEHAVSESGNAVFFESPDPVYLATCPSPKPPQLYVRLNDKATVEVSAPAPGVADPNGPQAAHFVSATPNGEKVLFTSMATLTADANTNNDTSEDLYQYDLTTGALTDLSSAGLRPSSGAHVAGVSGAAQSGETVYFVAAGKLTSDAVEDGANIYVYDKGQVSLAAALSTTPLTPPAGVSPESAALIVAESAVAHEGTGAAEATADGNYLLFPSTSTLTNFPNGGRSEVYRYSLREQSLICVSCATVAVNEAATIPTNAQSALPPQRVISDDGQHIFYGTKLLAAGQEPRDVYEWHNGETSLIAGSDGVRRSVLIGTTPSGDDVFVISTEALTPADESGGEEDIFDVRVDGGYPLPAKAPECGSNETCKDAGTTASTASPASLAPGLVGNIAPPAGLPKAAATATPKITIAGHTAKGAAITLSIRVPGKGELVVSGASVKTLKGAVAKAGTYKLKPELTANERKLLKRRHHLKLKLRILFTPSTGKASSDITAVTVKA